MKLKKTFEIDEEIVKIINGISKMFDIFEVEVIELAINNPKVYSTVLKVYKKISNEKLI